MTLKYLKQYEKTSFQWSKHGLFIDPRTADYEIINENGASHDADRLWMLYEAMINPTKYPPYCKEQAIQNIKESIEHLNAKRLDTTDFMKLKLYYYFLDVYSSKYTRIAESEIDIVEIAETTGYNMKFGYEYDGCGRVVGRGMCTNDEIDILKSILIQSCDIDSIESQLPRTILTSKFNIYEYFYNYLLMDFDVQVVPKRVMDKKTQKFVDYKLNEFLIPDKELRLKDEILSIKAKYKIEDRVQFFR